VNLAFRTLAVLASATTLAACSREAAPATASAEAPVIPNSTQTSTASRGPLSSDAGNGDAGDGGSEGDRTSAPPSSPSAGADGGASQLNTPTAGDAGPLQPRAGAASAAPLLTPLSVAVAIVGGREVPITRDGSTFVDPAAGFRVEIAVHLADGRMALHDEQDAMVASSGTTEIGASWTRYRLVPEGPLRPGTSYALWIDGAVTREAHDPGGRAYGPVVLRLKTTGERPAAPARKKRGKPRS
jgi:hypothetical protein